MADSANTLPQKLQEIVQQFANAPKMLRLELLLEYSKKVPSLPERLHDSEALERVHECQTPFFLLVEIEEAEDEEAAVHIFFDAPREAPTTRGFAGILYSALEGESPATIQSVPNDFYTQMKLAETISPLRLRGMEGIIGRLKKQVSKLSTAA